MAYTHLTPGRELELTSHVYRSERRDRVAQLVRLPLQDLEGLEAASVAQEEAIFTKLSEIEAQWLEQAAETAAVREARQYLKVRPAEHTSNQWKKDEYDRWERSNMVYKMTYRIYEHTHYDRTTQRSVTDSWELSWFICYNTVHNPNPDVTGSGWQIAGQDRKRFTEKAAMEKYLKGRIAAYDHLFTEIAPPIPRDQAGRFCVNGVLLPGYTIERPMEPSKEAVDELLSLLEDGETPEQEAPVPEDRPEAETAARIRDGPSKPSPHPQRQRPGKRREAPAR